MYIVPDHTKKVNIFQEIEEHHDFVAMMREEYHSDGVSMKTQEKRAYNFKMSDWVSLVLAMLMILVAIYSYVEKKDMVESAFALGWSAAAGFCAYIGIRSNNNADSDNSDHGEC